MVQSSEAREGDRVAEQKTQSSEQPIEEEEEDEEDDIELLLQEKDKTIKQFQVRDILSDTALSNRLAQYNCKTSPSNAVFRSPSP